MTSLKTLPSHERPREKLMYLGPTTLTNAELLAVILGKGSEGKDVLLLAHEVAEALSRIEEDTTWEALCEIPGVGPAKACQILASIEFSRRFLTRRLRLKIKTPADALPALSRLKGALQEEFVVLTLDGSNQLIKAHSVTLGLVNQSQIHPRETFHCAILDNAVSILLAHNHPSGNLEASEADLAATRRLVAVSKTMGIPILDHLIVSESGFSSIREKFPAYFN